MTIKSSIKFLFLLLVCVLPFYNVYHASQLESELAPTGATAEYCNTVIEINDTTSGKIPHFSVKFKDISLGKIYDFTFSSASNFNKGMTYNLIGNTTYEITFDIDDKFELINEDGSSISKIAISSGSVLLKWTLQEKNDEARTENTKNEEGDKLYNEWLEASMFIQTEEYDDLWNSLTSQWDNHIKEYFVKWKICTQEEWEMYFAEGLTDYEKFCWTNFYGLFVHSVNLDSPASYFKDEKAVHSRFVMIFSGLIKNRLEKNHPAQYERIDKAYKDLIYWQYTYFLENGDFYCFMTGGTYRGKNNVTASALLDAVKKDEERQNQELDAIENRFGENDKNTQKIDDIAEEIKTETVNENATLPSENITPTPETPTPEEIRESDSPQNEEKKGLSNILNAIRKNIISFTIGILAFTIVGVLHVIKKKKEKDNSEEDDDDGDE